MYGRAQGPAYRIETPRLVLRCWDPRDAPGLKAAIDASLAHLLPWMPWARDEPQSVESKLELLRQFRGRFDLGKDFVYGLFDRQEREVLGGSGLHPRIETPGRPGVERGVREIGYWIAAAHVGQGFATEAAAALARIGFELEHLERIEIHCEEENQRSAAIARRLGFHEDGLLRQRVLRPDGRLVAKRVFSMLAAEYDASPCSESACVAFDGLGRRTLDLPVPRAERRRSAFR